MAERARVTDPSQLPLVLELKDFRTLLGCSAKTVERIDRAGQLPEPFITEGVDKNNHNSDRDHVYRTRRWSRDSVIAWLDGTGPRRRGRRR